MKSDIEVWFEFVKTVEKIKKPNLALQQVYPKFVHVNHKQKSSVPIVLDNFEKRKNNLLTCVLTKMERRQFRSETTIDLHGYDRNIDSILENFCLKCIVNSINSITIISGKGEGIVKAAVKNWLLSNSHLVYGFFETKDSMGQSGAFGVRLRKKIA